MKQNKKKTCVLCLLLSAVMASSLCLAGCTGKAEAGIPGAVFSVDVDHISVPDEGAEVAQTFKLTSSETIDGTLTEKDFKLTGSFADMRVSEVSNDEKTISLTLSGVPVLEGAPTLGYVGEIGIPGKYFGSDKAVSAGIPVICLSDQKPETSYFYPYFDSMIDNDTSKELHIVLRPYGGSFAEDFSADKITFDGVLKDAQIVSLNNTDAGCELVVNVTADLDIHGAESTLGSITLAKGSMTNNPEEISYTRDFSADTYGRSLTKADLEKIKETVQAKKTTPEMLDFSEIGTIFNYGSMIGTYYGNITSSYQAITSMLAAFGLIKPGASVDVLRHQEIMNALNQISNQLEALQEDVSVVRSFAADNKRALEDLSMITTEDYLAGFHAHYDAMIKYTNEIENALQRNSGAILQLAEEYYDESADGEKAEKVIIDDVVEVGEDGAAENETETAEEEETKETTEEATEETTAETTTQTTAETTAETTTTAPPETTTAPRPLTDDEISRVLEDFGWKVCGLRQSNYYTIGQKLQLLEAEYTTAMVYLKNNNANPISRYCQIYSYIDNFSTTSLVEKELYALDLDCQFDRTLSYLMLLGGEYSQQENIGLYYDSYFPDVIGEATNQYGDPYCYLMKSYVRVADDAASAIYKPSKNVTILAEEDAKEFSRRRNGRSLKDELILAGFDENTFMNLQTNFDSGDFKSSEIGRRSNDRYYGIAFTFKRINGNHPRVQTVMWYDRMDGIFNYMKDDRNSYTMDGYGLYYDENGNFAYNQLYTTPCCGYISKGGTHYTTGWYVIEPMTYLKQIY